MEVRALKTEVKELKEENKRNLLKLTQEVIAVKLENRGKPSESQSPQFDQLPFYHKKDLDDFEAQLLQKPELMEKFKLLSFSWRGTADKPSAEKCLVTTIIKIFAMKCFKWTKKPLDQQYKNISFMQTKE
ncbi:uncharacterized protein LOC120775812 [Bactrocera tryoni]|uniref:uncharacterized protein LOC120775812 n=1 Tax=Bactrocera tryoni TaxID=59916 RepID=UPI001A98ADA2|nr:uncharacterized protein LOC120775812 [Bactrocera tryoni]